MLEKCAGPSLAHFVFGAPMRISYETRKLEAVYKSIFDAVYVVDRQKRIVSFNEGAEVFTGYKAEDILGKTCSELFAHADEKGNLLCGVNCILDEVLSSGRSSLPRRVFIKTSTGMQRQSLTAAAPILDAHGRAEGAAIFLREATNELRIEQLKSDFLSVVSHELRIPLATIKESISLLSDAVAGPVTDQQMNVLLSIKRQIDRLNGLVESLLDVSSIESGRFKVKRKKLDISELIRSLQQFFQPTASKKSVALTVELPPDLPKVIGDYDRVTQVISNLLNNAFKFTEAGGTVSIRCMKLNDNFLECSVVDTGSGIAADLLVKLFGKFEQLGIEENKRRGGAGLGLVISRKIVEDLGGTIRAESSPGKGSTFSFTLPLYNERLALELELGASIKDAKQRYIPVSLLDLEADDLQEKDFENVVDVIQHLIRGPNDKAVKHGNSVCIILPETDRNGAMSVKERIKERLKNSGFADKIKRFGTALYPDDALTEVELIDKVRAGLTVF